MRFKKTYILGAAIAAVASLAAAAPALAQTNVPAPGERAWGRGGAEMGARMRPEVTGSVTAINGTTLTVSGWVPTAFAKDEDRTSRTAPATTTFSVDASHAVVIKGFATSTLSSIALGDRIGIQGTVSGTSVAATLIRDGAVGPRGMWSATSTKNFPVKGNGQPVVAGTISAISGSNLTLGTSSGTSYSVDASNAAVVKAGAAASASSLAVGDHVVVQGAISGTSVTASSVIDQPAASQNAAGNSSGAPARHGFFGAIGGFFSRIFGF